MAMNSWIEFTNRVCAGLDSDETPRDVPFLLSSSLNSGAKEFEATKRVYNHPIFKQNSPRAFPSSLRASAGHQKRETNAAQTTPAVTAIAR